MVDYFKLISQLSLPYLETPQEIIPKIFRVLERRFNLKHNSSQKFIDLGSGNGQIVIYTALNYRIKSFGVEINETLLLEAKEKIKILRKRNRKMHKLVKLIKIRNIDLFKVNLHDYDYIYIYSLPTMHKYLNHVFKSAKRHSVITSFMYELKGFDSYLQYKDILEIKHDNKVWKVYFYIKI
jgi:SAM-dependent methyltransferase